MISKPLSIRLKFLTIIGCYDIHEAVGKETRGRYKSSVISEALDALIEAMRAEGKLPTYSTEDEIEARLSQIFGLEPEQDQISDLIEYPAKNLPSRPILPNKQEAEQGVLDVIKDAVNKIEEEKTASKDSDVPDIESEASEETSSKELTFEDIVAQVGEKDSLVNEAKGNKAKEYALALVYSQISRTDWGEDTAKRVISETLPFFQEKEEEAKE